MPCPPIAPYALLSSSYFTQPTRQVPAGARNYSSATQPPAVPPPPTSFHQEDHRFAIRFANNSLIGPPIFRPHFTSFNPSSSRPSDHRECQRPPPKVSSQP